MMCPCYSGLSYEECCAPYHAGKPAPTPLSLMRSRYSGYALKKIDYILKTESASLHRDAKQLVQFANETSFDRLDILEAAGDYVTFRAHLSRGGTDVSFTEKSHFKKVDGKWIYDSGVVAIEGKL